MATTTEPTIATNTPTTAPDLRRPLPSPKALAIHLELPDRYAEIEALLADTGITPERFIRTTVHALTKAPQVMRTCSGESILLAVLDAARMGLEPTGAYGGAHLVPRSGKAVLEVDWRGLIRMAARTGAISRAETALAYEGDDFWWVRGTTPSIHHVPSLGPERGGEELGNVTHAYSIAWLPDGSSLFEVMTLAELNSIMARSSSKKEGVVVGPWVTDWGEMARKTTIRRLFKYLPDVLNPALAFALEREDRAMPPLIEQDAQGAPPTRRGSIIAALSGEALNGLAEAAGPCTCEQAPDGGLVTDPECPVHHEAQ